MNNLENHSYSQIFPLMEGEEYQALKDSIKANGLLEPIITFEGKILDGRNRYKACLEVKVEPRFETYTGKDPAEYAFSVNFHRRHLTPSVLACCAAEYNQLHKFTSEQISAKAVQTRLGKLSDTTPINTLQASGDKFNIGFNSASIATTLLNNRKELFAKVKSGESTLREAYREYRADKGSSPHSSQKKASVVNITKSVGIAIPDCAAPPFEIFKFIDSMAAHGWRLEIKTEPYTTFMGEVGARYYANWFGNGFASFNHHSWSDSKSETEFRRAVITAAHEKLNKIKQKKAA